MGQELAKDMFATFYYFRQRMSFVMPITSLNQKRFVKSTFLCILLALGQKNYSGLRLCYWSAFDPSVKLASSVQFVSSVITFDILFVN